ncbi:MAG: hypothetical protein Q9181_002504 [Wetmoreana brouardii]
MASKSGPQIKRKSVPLIGMSAEAFQIGPLSPSISDSLTNGTTIPAPSPPTPPPKEVTMPPETPPSQQAPLSDATYGRYFPLLDHSTIPGTFPAEDPTPPDERAQTPPKLKKLGYEASATASSSPYTPYSQQLATSRSPRRPSSVFRLLPFKRKLEDRTSSSADSISSGRPQTPGADSIIGSLADSGAGLSLNKNKSGSFWGRRKSSLSAVTAADDARIQNGNPASMRQRTVSRGSAAGGEAVYDGDEEFPQRLNKKKSLTFWRRTSSLGLDKMGQSYGQQQTQRNKSDPREANGYHQSEDTIMSEPDPITLRPRTPPPQLPEVGHVVNENGGLMGEEDWFGNIR